MNVTWHEAKSEIDFLLGLTGQTVQITKGRGLVDGDPFDAIVQDAEGGDGVTLVYQKYDETWNRAVGEPQTINTNDIFELAIY